MARRKEGGIELLASVPWPIGFVLGIVFYVGFRYGIGWYLLAQSNPFSQTLGRQAAGGAFAVMAWISLGACWIGALLSFIGRGRRRRLLDAQTGLDSLRAISWREFELLVGEAFRRQGYVVQETGLGGADGGIDLILRKHGQTTLVQCKQWKNQRVDVKVVREMFGLLTDRGAAAVKIVAIGDYTADAQRFAQGKPIELIHGAALLAMVRAVQTPGSAQKAAVRIEPVMTAPIEHAISQNHVCPKCGAEMVRRENRKTKESFWGCAKYPACHGTRAM
ncbi:restriction endonuclease [Dyella acidiphila]|uniref:Restriction endonuclease n=1 Tax=Dyella acidiphila TaxID=2775866 RepID=A0ABR9G759_9GAMM|nr:restriction endonuclease [Dyella acidiphila]MBE1159884.1 restriction endonuclease [Dyella acidiphila]